MPSSLIVPSPLRYWLGNHKAHQSGTGGSFNEAAAFTLWCGLESCLPCSGQDFYYRACLGRVTHRPKSVMTRWFIVIYHRRILTGWTGSLVGLRNKGNEEFCRAPGQWSVVDSSLTTDNWPLTNWPPAMNLPRLILASASPRRAELLREMGLRFRVVPSDAAETRNEQLTARELCQLNAYRKARAVAKKIPDALVLGADTLVYLGTRLFGKPANHAEAEQMLERLQGRTHQVVTGICLIHLRRFRQKIFAETTQVTFRSLDPKQIRYYLGAVNPLDKAGAYAIQEKGDLIVDRIVGSFSNVVGLPIERLNSELVTGDW